MVKLVFAFWVASLSASTFGEEARARAHVKRQPLLCRRCINVRIVRLGLASGIGAGLLIFKCRPRLRLGDHVVDDGACPV